MFTVCIWQLLDRYAVYFLPMCWNWHVLCPWESCGWLVIRPCKNISIVLFCGDKIPIKGVFAFWRIILNLLNPDRSPQFKKVCVFLYLVQDNFWITMYTKDLILNREPKMSEGFPSLNSRPESLWGKPSSPPAGQLICCFLPTLIFYQSTFHWKTAFYEKFSYYRYFTHSYLFR